MRGDRDRRLAQRRHHETRRCHGAEGLLDAHLGLRVEAHRQRLRFLRPNAARGRGAVDGAGRRVQEPRYSGLARQLSEPNRGPVVDGLRQRRIAIRCVVAGQPCQIDHHVVATNDARLDGAYIAVDEPQPRVVRDVRERCFAELEAIEDGGAVTRGEQLGDESRPDVARAAGATSTVGISDGFGGSSLGFGPMPASTGSRADSHAASTVTSARTEHKRIGHIDVVLRKNCSYRIPHRHVGAAQDAATSACAVPRAVGTLFRRLHPGCTPCNLQPPCNRPLPSKHSNCRYQL
jgi:hypothetical protein